MLELGIFHHIIHKSYGPLIEVLPQTLANMLHEGSVGVWQGTPTTADASQPQTLSSDVNVIVTASAPDSYHQPNKVVSPHPIVPMKVI